MEFHSDMIGGMAIPPGEFIRECMEDEGLSSLALADRLGLSECGLEDLFEGRIPVTDEIAGNLAQIFDVPSHLWLGLEHEYKLTLNQQDIQLN